MRRCAELEQDLKSSSGGCSSSSPSAGGVLEGGGEELFAEVEALRAEKRQSVERRAALEAEVNRLELELELAMINSEGGHEPGEQQGGTDHLRKVIVRLEAQHAATEQSYRRDTEAGQQQVQLLIEKQELINVRLETTKRVCAEESALRLIMTNGRDRLAGELRDSQRDLHAMQQMERLARRSLRHSQVSRRY